MNMVKVRADQTYSTAVCRELLGAVPGEGAIDAPLNDNIIVGLVQTAAHYDYVDDANDRFPVYLRRLCATLWGLNGDLHWHHYRYHRPVNFLLRVMSLLDMRRSPNGTAGIYHARRSFYGDLVTEFAECAQSLNSVVDCSMFQRSTWYTLDFKNLMKFAKAGLVRKVKASEAHAVLESVACHLNPEFSLDPSDTLALPTLHCNTSRGGHREVEYADCMAWAQLTTAIKMLPQYPHQLLTGTRLGMLRDNYARLHAQRVRYATWVFAQPRNFQECMNLWDAIVFRKFRLHGYDSLSLVASPPWWDESYKIIKEQFLKPQVDFKNDSL
jgi:hypothetical protein